jgi:hypothetical protein
MQQEMDSRMIDIELDGIIQFQQTDDTIECVVNDITEDYAEAIVISSDPRICMTKDIYLKVLLPNERSPVKCTGRIIRYSEDEVRPKAQRNYLARILITHISRIDRRRLELVIARKRMFIRSGYGLKSSW